MFWKQNKRFDKDSLATSNHWFVRSTGIDWQLINGV